MDQIIGMIFDEMGSDDDNDSQGLVEYYNAASSEQREAMNEMCIYLCGWSLETIFVKIRTYGGPNYWCRRCMKRALFALGQIVATPGALALMKQSNIDGLKLLQRHVTGDWGDLNEADK